MRRTKPPLRHRGDRPGSPRRPHLLNDLPMDRRLQPTNVGFWAHRTFRPRRRRSNTANGAPLIDPASWAERPSWYALKATESMSRYNRAPCRRLSEPRVRLVLTTVRSTTGLNGRVLSVVN